MALIAALRSVEKVGAGGTALAVLILLTGFDLAPKRPHGSATAWPQVSGARATKRRPTSCGVLPPIWLRVCAPAATESSGRRGLAGFLLPARAGRWAREQPTPPTAQPLTKPTRERANLPGIAILHNENYPTPKGKRSAASPQKGANAEW